MTIMYNIIKRFITGLKAGDYTVNFLVSNYENKSKSKNTN